ncbi:MAG: exo-alpha-sialidase [Acidobacteria bacterium]|nr:exo-alpha-sialidase [Acidobacteriota bacterium]
MNRREFLGAVAAGLTVNTRLWSAQEIRLAAGSARHLIVYREPGRFAGWPANNGAWSWGNELLVGFVLGYYQEKQEGHSIDTTKPERSVLARSRDGGETWALEDPRNYVGDGRKAVPCPGGIRFGHPDFAMRVGNHTLIQLRDREGQFFISYSRGRTWEGPFLFPSFGFELTSRTDYIVTGQQECLLFLSVNQPQVQGGNYKDRAFAARTADGGRTFQFLGWMAGDSVDARSVMPSTVQLPDRRLVTAVRRKSGVDGDYKNWIEIFTSADGGITWTSLGQAADTKGHNGNPPSLVRLKDGRLCLAYGYRAEPYGIRARISSDAGRTWSGEIVLREDGRTWDLGYPRSFVRPDGKVVTVYYYTTDRMPEQHIAATIWDPPSQIGIQALVAPRSQ